MSDSATAPRRRSEHLFPAGIPRLNHVAVSLPSPELSGTRRAELLDWHDECFGWVELAELAEEGRRSVLAVGHWDQFVFLHAEDEPMSAARMDHFGMSVSSMEDFTAAWERVAAHDDGDVELIEPSVDRFEVVNLHSFYARFRLPMMVEVQFWEFT